MLRSSKPTIDPPDRNWRDPAIFDTKYWKWARRARVASKLLQDSRWIVDVGCGQQSLRHFLSRHQQYLPADLRRWTPDTAVCDINAGQYPDKYLALADTAVMLGVVEYLKDAPTVFRHLATLSERVVVSYNPTDTFVKRAPHWITHYSRDELVSIIDDAGFSVDRAIWFDRKRLMLGARNRSFNEVVAAERQSMREAFDAMPNITTLRQRLVHVWRTASTMRPGFIRSAL